MNDKWKCVEDSLKLLEEQLEKHNVVANAAGLSIESPLSEPLYKVEQTLINTLALLVGDKGDALNWYVYENSYGGNAYDAGVDADVRPICNIEDLRWLVELENKEEGNDK